MAVVIPILGDDAGLQKAIKSATKSFNDLKKSAVDVAKKAAIGFAALGAAGAVAVKAAIDDQKSQSLLAQQIRATTGATNAQIASIESFVDKTQRATGVADDQLRPALATLVRGTGDLSKAQSLLGLSLDIAAATGKDTESVSIALSKAYNGNIGALTKLGVPIDEATKKSKDFGTAQAQLTAMFGGAAATAADTMAGRMARLQIAFGEIVEQVGYYLMPIVERFAGFLLSTVVPYAQKLADAMGENGLAGVFGVLGTSITDKIKSLGTFGTVMVSAAAAIGAVVLATKAFTLYTKLATLATQLWNAALLANPIGLIVLGVVAVIAILAVLYVKFEGVRKIVNTVINAIIAIIEDWLNAWIRVINLIIDGINLLIKAANLFGAGLKTLGHIGEVEFGRVGAAAATAKAGIKSVGEVAGAMFAKEGGTSNIEKATNAFTGLGDGAGGAGKKIETAKEKLGKYIDALKGMTSAQRAYRDANKSVIKSDQDLLTAKNRLTAAQTNFNNVLNGYGANSVQAGDAQSELAKAQREVTRAGFDVQKSVFAVADAEKELRNAYASGDSQQITEAQIALAEAQLAVSDATDTQQDSVKNLTTKQTLLDEAVNGAATSSDTFKDAAKELKDAQDGLVDATDQQTDAYERQKDMLDALNESTRKAIKLRGGVVPKDAAAAETAAGVKPTASGTGMYESFMDAVRAMYPNSKALKSKTPLVDSRKAFPALYKEYKDAGLALANGGIVTRATQALIGESGAEAVIPLDRLDSGSTVNITVNAGMGSDGTRIGQMIVNELQAYQRRVGSLPLKVSA